MIFKFVRGTAEILKGKNLIFREGEPVYETDTGLFKIGNGVLPYIELPYFVSGSPNDSGGVDVGALLAHINDATPHPVYDDGPSLLLLYNNAKV